MPDLIAHKGASLSRAMSHQWLTTEGVFGVALGVSSGFIFLFVLFGSLLDRAGAGNYFIQSAFALLGHLRGGPAKAAVVSSAATGIISGSSIANVVTTGTFTIPLMKRVGYRADQAGAVEVSSSVNGQLMPPVMGAAAFLMVEYVGIPYTEVIKHAFLPAIISYIALFYIVHLEALKADLQGLPRRSAGDRRAAPGLVRVDGRRLHRAGRHRLLRHRLDQGRVAVGCDLHHRRRRCSAAYIGLLWIGSRQPELKLDDPDAPVFQLPETAPTLLSGLHYLLSVVVLIWCLMIEQLSPGLSAFWATIFMIFVMLTQRPLIAMLRGRGDYGGAHRRSASTTCWRPRSRRAQHDRHRRGHRGGRHHRRHRLADRHRPGDDRGRRTAVGRQPDADAGAGRLRQPDPRHGPADDGQLHRRLDADGAGGGRTRRAERADRAADRGPPVRLLFRADGRRHAAGRAGVVRRGGDRSRRPDQDRRHRILLQHAHRDPAVPVHLQHPVADDRHRRAVPPGADGRQRDRRRC